MRVCLKSILIKLFTELIAIKIVKIVVPEIIQYGMQDAVILDCDYTYGNNTSGLVVKWFFRNKARPVYQWIVSQKPQYMGILRGRVDLAYRVSKDPLKMYRALRIVKPNTDISGDYTCVVSTFMEEDSRTKQMIVFVPETNFRLIQNKTADDTVNVICAAAGAFPAPNLTLATPERRAQFTLMTADMPEFVDFPRMDENELLLFALGVYQLKLAKSYYGGHVLDNGAFTIELSNELSNEDLAELQGNDLWMIRGRLQSRQHVFLPLGPISTTSEMPTAADMQLAAAIGSKGTSTCTVTALVLLPALAQSLLAVK
ncbi:unnamed protein product [Parnassius apollo]|uniref:(apollo) hypothetical protein n=1 Tax=Parnassius apollo TaxID=110799 RepID=A0A8S3Y7J7_PARAO|nr:unnamed protein product [Parnassius apollo]